MEIDKKLSEINISKLIDDVGLPFRNITDEEIELCLQQNILLTTNSIYSKSNDNFSYKGNKIFDLLKITTIVNEIQNNTYDYNYPIVVYEDSIDGGMSKYDADGNGLYHIRAFWYCRKNMYMSVNYSG